MPTSYPTSLDSTTIPGAGETLGGSTPTHPEVHDINNGAIEALEAKLGTGDSTPTLGKVLVGTGTGTSAWEDGATATVHAAKVTLTPSNLTDSVTLPAGAWLVDFLLDFADDWDGDAMMDLGDGDDPNGYIAAAILAVGLNTPPLRQGSYAAMEAANSAFTGAYNGGGGTGVMKRTYPTGGAITATITGSPTVGETTITVVYAVPATGTPQGIQKAVVTLSSADILDLHNTPVTLVAAPGALHFVVVHRLVTYMTAGVSAYAVSSSEPSIVYAGSGVAVANDAVYTGAGSDEIYTIVPVPVYVTDVADAVNRAVVLTTDGAITDGDGTLTVTVWYTVEDVP